MESEDRRPQAKKAQEQVAALEVSGLPEKLDAAYDNKVWEKTAQRCLSCGVCTYVCPTCHCFGFCDGTTERIRFHDACMFSSFTLEASGHNPRAKASARLQQRIMHKFNYTVKNHNQTFCSGCGRCVLYCPVNIDLREIIEEVRT